LRHRSAARTRAVRAALTITFVGLKVGFLSPAARAYTGEVQVVDIGCPRQAVADAVANVAVRDDPAT
jgi:hypothetical protein